MNRKLNNNIKNNIEIVIAKKKEMNNKNDKT